MNDAMHTRTAASGNLAVYQQPDSVHRPIEEPKISIVILNYNYQAYVGDAIRSALDQTYANIECIVVDDGSTDGSRDIIDSFSGIRIIQKDNSGQTGAARAALPYLTGQVVLFLDSDDFLFPDACAAIGKSWENGFAAVLYRLAIVRDGEVSDDSLPVQRFARDAADFVRKYGYLPAAPTSGNAYASDVARRIFSDAVGLNDRCFFDTWLIACSPFFGKVGTIDRCLGAYRMHGANDTLVANHRPELKTIERGVFRHWKAHAYYQYWAQRSAARFDVNSPNANSWSFLKGPYWLKRYILARHISAAELDLPEHPETACILECCREFLTFPGIPLSRRLANSILMFGYLILPRRIGRPLALAIST